MNALRLTAPRQFAGFVDATHDSALPTARSLEQCLGHQRSSTAEIVPMAAPAGMHREDALRQVVDAFRGKENADPLPIAIDEAAAAIAAVDAKRADEDIPF